MATTLVGLDFGQTEIRACVFQMGFNSLEPKALYHQDVEMMEDEVPFEAQARAARLLLQRNELAGETVVCALPPHLISTCIVEMPFKKRKIIETLLPSTFLEEILPFDASETWYDYQVIEETEEGSVLLVSYMLRSTFELHYEWLSTQEISPKLLTPLALSYVHLLPENTPQTVVCIDLGQEYTQWSIIHNKSVQRIHACSYGGQEITKALSETFKLDLKHTEQGKLAEATLRNSQEIQDLEQETHQSRAQVINQAILSGLNPIIRELNRTLYAYEQETENDLQCMYIFGGGSQLKGILPYLSERLGLKAAFMPLPEFLTAHSSHATLNQSSPDLSAYALGTHLAQYRSNQAINFRKNEYAYKGDLDFMRLGMIALVFVLLCVCGLTGTRIYYEKEALKQEISQLNAEVSQLGSKLVKDEDVSASALLSTISNKKKLKMKVPEVSAFSTLGELSTYIDTDTKVDVDSLNISLLNRGRFEMVGKTDTVGNVSQLIAAIKKSKCFSKQVKKDRVNTLPDGQVKFRITAESSCKK